MSMHHKDVGSCSFKPFRFDLSVCELCGKLSTEHTGAFPNYRPYKEAMWNVLLSKGSIHSYYGGIDYKETADLYVHMGILTDHEQFKFNYSLYTEVEKRIKHNRSRGISPCEIDWDKVEEPVVSTVEEFNGTFTDSNLHVPAVVGRLYCKCGEYEYEPVSITDMTLGQLIWQAVMAGEILEPYKEDYGI